MGAVAITFLGGPETGGVDKTVWGTDTTGRVEFPLRVPVVIDPLRAANGLEREFLGHIVKKASNNPFFKVEEVDGTGEAARITRPAPRSAPAPRKRVAAPAD